MFTGDYATKANVSVSIMAETIRNGQHISQDNQHLKE